MCVRVWEEIYINLNTFIFEKLQSLSFSLSVFSDVDKTIFRFPFLKLST